MDDGQSDPASTHLYEHAKAKIEQYSRQGNAGKLLYWKKFQQLTEIEWSLLSKDHAALRECKVFVDN